MKSLVLVFLIGLGLLFQSVQSAHAGGIELDLSRQTQPLFFIATSPTADPSTKAEATRFANHLSTISGAKFLLTEDSMDAGIYIGTITDFPETGFDLDANNASRSQEYVLKTMETGLYIIGASPIAVKSAVSHILRHIDAEHVSKDNTPKTVDRIRIAIDHTETAAFALPKIFWSDN